MFHSTALYRPETGAERLYRLISLADEALASGATVLRVDSARVLRGRKSIEAARAAWISEVTR